MENRIVAVQVPVPIYEALEFFAKAEGISMDRYLKNIIHRDIEGVLDSGIKDLAWSNFKEAMRELAPGED